MSAKTWFSRGWRFGVDLQRRINEDGVRDAAAALSYSAMLALFPFLIGVVTLASLLVEPEVVETLLVDLENVAPPEVTRLVGAQLRGLIAAGNSSLLTVSVIGSYWAASGGMSALMRAFNRVNRVRETRPWWKTKGIALIVTFVAVFLLLLAAIIAVATPSIARAIGGAAGAFINVLRLPIAGAAAIFAWELLYHVLPNTKRPFRFYSPGSIVAVVLWLVASWGFSAYVSNFGEYEVTYGALGAVVVLLLWLWISSLSALLGMEINVLLGKSGDRGDPEDRPRGD